MDGSPRHSRGAALDATVDVAIVGAGVMGAGIAQVAAFAGHQVRLFDTREGASQRAVDTIIAAFDKMVAKDRMTMQHARDAGNRLHCAASLDALRGCGLVIEAIVEDLEAKRALFKDLEAVVDEEAILATNTSSISVTAIGAAMRHPERFAGMHFFNPAPLMPLVEVVHGLATAPAVSDTLHATALRWGKTPVHARSTPGFIVNRVARPFYAEGLRLLNEHAVDCATIDAIMRESGGFRMGPFELMDLIGNDVNYAVTRSVFDAYYGDPRYTPSVLQWELVQAGHLGRKSGRGFYTYGESAAPIVPQTAEAAPAPAHIRLCGEGVFSVALAERLTLAGVAFERRLAYSDERIAEADGFVLYRTDGRTATARAAATGIANTVLVDLSLDPATASRIAIAVADQAGDHAAASAAGLLQAAGYAVSKIDDAPGMIVMRTVAMLANEAADAVNQGVCSASDCDLAMRKGVNYPLGPLEWAEQIGLAEVARVLDRLAQAYGAERYRVSPLLRRKALVGTHFFESAATNAHSAQVHR